MNWIVARSVARFTIAEVTQGTPRIAFSTRDTQDAQVMPSMPTLADPGLCPAGTGTVSLSTAAAILLVLLSTAEIGNPSKHGKVKQQSAFISATSADP
jgi:hypothetical protein